MTSLEPGAGASSGRVLIVAPFKRDAALIEDALARHTIAAVACVDPAHLTEALAEGGAALVMSQEGLTPSMLDVVAGYLAAQPNWAELPLILLLDGDLQSGALLDGLRDRLPSSKLTVLQRPVRILELVTAVQTAVSARRRQLQLRDHIAWQEELQLELNHRVKNVLANVMAIYYMTLRQTSTLAEFATSFEGRLTALSGVHSALVGSQDPQALEAVAELVLAPYRSASNDRVTIDGPALELTPQNAVNFALCLHELATNASKYGAFSVPEGTVALNWAFEAVDGRDMVRLTWVERDGPAVRTPTRRGYGTAFVQSAMRGLKSTIDYDYAPQGLSCRMLMPVDHVVAGSK